jgi:hypothetical protein
MAVLLYQKWYMALILFRYYKFRLFTFKTLNKLLRSHPVLVLGFVLTIDDTNTVTIYFSAPDLKTP